MPKTRIKYGGSSHNIHCTTSRVIVTLLVFTLALISARYKSDIWDAYLGGCGWVRTDTPPTLDKLGGRAEGRMSGRPPPPAYFTALYPAKTG